MIEHETVKERFAAFAMALSRYNRKDRINRCQEILQKAIARYKTSNEVHSVEEFYDLANTPIYTSVEDTGRMDVVNTMLCKYYGFSESSNELDNCICRCLADDYLRQFFGEDGTSLIEEYKSCHNLPLDWNPNDIYFEEEYLEVGEFCKDKAENNLLKQENRLAYLSNHYDQVKEKEQTRYRHTSFPKDKETLLRDCTRSEYFDNKDYSLFGNERSSNEVTKEDLQANYEALEWLKKRVKK